MVLNKKYTPKKKHTVPMNAKIPKNINNDRMGIGFGDH